MYPIDTPTAEYAPLWEAVDDAPAKVWAAAEQQSRSEGAHLRRNVPDIERRVTRNQYGDYCVIWIWKNPRLARYDFEAVTVVPPDNINGYAAGGFPSQDGFPSPVRIAERATRTYTGPRSSGTKLD